MPSLRRRTSTSRPVWLKTLKSSVWRLPTAVGFRGSRPRERLQRRLVRGVWRCFTTTSWTAFAFGRPLKLQFRQASFAAPRRWIYRRSLATALRTYSRTSEWRPKHFMPWPQTTATSPTVSKFWKLQLKSSGTRTTTTKAAGGFTMPSPSGTPPRVKSRLRKSTDFQMPGTKFLSEELFLRTRA